VNGRIVLLNEVKAWIRKILKERLSAKIQSGQFRSTIMIFQGFTICLALALFICKLENSSSGETQLQDAFGELNDDRWNQVYRPNFPSGMKLKKICMKDVSAKKSVDIPREEMMKYQSIVEGSRFLVNEGWIFKLCLFLALTQPQDSQSIGTVSGLHSKYLYILRRRLHSNYAVSLSRADPNGFANIYSGLANLNRLAIILLKIMNSNSN
jgi:hypothetical protein